MNAPRKLRVMIACAAALLTASAAAEETTDLRDLIDPLVLPTIEQDAVVGMSIGVIHDGRTHIFNYGETSPGSGQKPTGDTVYEIGSISKTFTGILLADMAQRGLVQLGNPVQKHLPATVKIPRRDGRSINLEQLSTHTSGLPRMPNNFDPADPTNPFADYTIGQLYAFLSSHTLRRSPGERYEYSNLGAGLLGHVLARHADQSYEALLLERIARPLGMTDTAVAFTDDMRRRLAPGHNMFGLPVPNWDIVTLAGAGGIRSTVNDMLKYLAANLDPDDSLLGRAIRESHKSRHTLDSGIAVALGWHIARDGQTRWHNGQTGGYHSMIMFHRPSHTAVVVLGNTSPAHQVDLLAEQIMRHLIGDRK